MSQHPLCRHADTSYDPKRDLARRRKEKKKKIKDYHDALKKKKNKLSESVSSTSTSVHGVTFS